MGWCADLVQEKTAARRLETEDCMFLLRRILALSLKV